VAKTEPYTDAEMKKDMENWVAQMEDPITRALAEKEIKKQWDANKHFEEW
jgi:hypothetical protein